MTMTYIYTTPQEKELPLLLEAPHPMSPFLIQHVQQAHTILKLLDIMESIAHLQNII